MTYPHAKLALTVHQIKQMVSVILNGDSPFTADDIDYALNELRTAFPITHGRDFTDATIVLRATNKALMLEEFNVANKEEDRLLRARDHGSNVDSMLHAVIMRLNWLKSAYEAFNTGD